MLGAGGEAGAFRLHGDKWFRSNSDLAMVLARIAGASAGMVDNSRLSNDMRGAGLLRRALTDALFVGRERRTLGRRLIELRCCAVSCSS